MKNSLKTAMSIIVVLFICSFFIRGKISHEKFDSDKWKNSNLNSEENWSLRWDMMNSLRNNHDLIGMSEKEIINLLGKPDESFPKEKTYIYSLGYSHKGINTGFLSLKLNNKGIVTGINVQQG